MSSDCSQNLACINRKCVDPCVNACGERAKCSVVNHIVICECGRDAVGDPFVQCRVQVQAVESKCDVDCRSNESEAYAIVPNRKQTAAEEKRIPFEPISSTSDTKFL